MKRFNPISIGLLFLVLSTVIVSYGGKGCLWWTDDDELIITGSSAVIDAPSALTATAVSDVQIDLGWDDNSPNEQGFRIEYKQGISGTYTQFATVPPNIITYVATVTEAITYYFRVKSYNPIFESDYSNVISATSFVSAPFLVTATATAGEPSCPTQLFWSDGSSVEDGFEIKRRTWKSSSYVAVTNSPSNTGPSPIFINDTVSRAATYRYIIRSYKVITDVVVITATSAWVYSNYLVTPVDSNNDVGLYNSLAVTSDGTEAYIAYYDTEVGYLDLKYATITDSGTVVTETIDSTGNVGQHTSLALDTSGNPYISYYDLTNDCLKCISNTTGTWVMGTVDNIPGTGQYTSIACNTSDQFSISYFLDDPGDLKLATNATGNWVTSSIDIPVAQRPTATGIVGQYTSIKVVGNIRHISYFDFTNKKLKYYLSSPSVIEQVPDNTAVVGQYNSLALDQSGNVHISYYDATNSALKYATNASGAWVLTTVDNSAAVGQYTSIAIRTDTDPDYIYISYYDATNTALKYAYKTTGGWGTTTIDGNIADGAGSTKNVGWYTSIAVDSNGKIHISYYDVTNGNLKYWTNK